MIGLLTGFQVSSAAFWRLDTGDLCQCLCACRRSRPLERMGIRTSLDLLKVRPTTCQICPYCCRFRYLSSLWCSAGRHYQMCQPYPWGRGSRRASGAHRGSLCRSLEVHLKLVIASIRRSWSLQKIEWDPRSMFSRQHHWLASHWVDWHSNLSSR